MSRGAGARPALQARWAELRRQEALREWREDPQNRAWGAHMDRGPRELAEAQAAFRRPPEERGWPPGHGPAGARAALDAARHSR